MHVLCGQQFSLLGGGYEPVVQEPAGALLLLLLLHLYFSASLCVKSA